MYNVYNRFYFSINRMSWSFLRAAKVKFKMPLSICASKLEIRSNNFISADYFRQFALHNNRNITKGIRNSDSNDYTDPECIKSKAYIISKLNFKCDEDASPFYKLSVKTLLKIYNTTKKDVEKGYCKNRLYYLAERLKCSPSHLSKSVASRTFIYSLSFDWLEKSLNTLLDLGVSEDRILRDLWVLKYHSKTIEERLLKVQKMGVDNLYPWMVRCSENILNRSISITQETKTILGDIKSTKIYLANRLNTTPEAVEEMYFSIPALKRIRAPKVKKFLDFLMEEGFKVEEIAKKPRVLSASQNTVKLRLEKLRKLGLKEINLNVLCRSRKDFKKFCESLEAALDEKDL